MHHTVQSPLPFDYVYQPLEILD